MFVLSYVLRHKEYVGSQRESRKISKITLDKYQWLWYN